MQRKNAHLILVEKLKGRDHFGNLGIESVISECLKIHGVGMQTEFFWLDTASSDGVLRPHE